MKKKGKGQDRRRRIFNVELRRAAEGEGLTQIVGRAIVYDQVSYGEVIRKGACTKTLRENKDVKAYWSHDMAKPLGRTTNDTLALEQDEKGLLVCITPNLETSFGRDALASVERGDVSQMSFGFRAINAGTITEDGEDIYEIRELQLYEVSPVAEPWYPGTAAEARDREEEERDVGSAAPSPTLAADAAGAAPQDSDTNRDVGSAAPSPTLAADAAGAAPGGEETPAPGLAAHATPEGRSVPLLKMRLKLAEQRKV